jgi:hypothetical protein
MTSMELTLSTILNQGSWLYNNRGLSLYEPGLEGKPVVNLNQGF